MFPENFAGFWDTVIVKRAVQKGIVEIDVEDIRDHADGSFRHLDDSPCGGGAGMLMKCPPVIHAIRAVKRKDSRVILMDPIGKPFDQKKARELAGLEDIVFVCGHYEGFDARIYEEADECISLGNFILTGGELPSQVITDSILRLQEGTIRQSSTEEESFETDRLEYPQYTRPVDFEGKKVPKVLLSGNHKKIREWRIAMAAYRTLQYRPDLVYKHPLTEEEKHCMALYPYEHVD